MPIDHRQLFNIEQPDITSALIRGNELASQTRNAPVLDRILKNQAQAGEIENTAASQEQVERGVQVMGRLSESLLKLESLDERRAFLNAVSPQLSQIGLDPKTLAQFDIGDDKRLQMFVEQGQMLGGVQADPTGVPVLVQTDDGPAFAQQVQNADGSFSSVVTPIEGTLTDRKGLTTGGRVTEAGNIATVREGAETEGFGDRRVVEADTAAPIASETTRGSGIAARQSEAIVMGLDAAKGVPVLRRSLELLESIKTGGIAAARVRIKQFFGVEGADEGELSANLGKAVLSQLRATFGAQFTQAEGERLEGIEARFGASSATNKRLLQMTLKIVENASNRGIKNAIDAKDFRAAADIQELMDLDLQPPDAPTVLNFDSQGNPIP